LQATWFCPSRSEKTKCRYFELLHPHGNTASGPAIRIALCAAADGVGKPLVNAVVCEIVAKNPCLTSRGLILRLASVGLCSSKIYFGASLSCGSLSWFSSRGAPAAWKSYKFSSACRCCRNCSMFFYGGRNHRLPNHVLSGRSITSKPEVGKGSLKSFVGLGENRGKHVRAAVCFRPSATPPLRMKRSLSSCVLFLLRGGSSGKRFTGQLV